MEQPQLIKTPIRSNQIDDFFRTDLAKVYKDPRIEYSVTGDYTENYWYTGVKTPGGEYPAWLTDLSTWFERIWHDPYKPIVSDLSGQLYWFYKIDGSVDRTYCTKFYSAYNYILKNSKSGGFSTSTSTGDGNPDSFWKAFNTASGINAYKASGNANKWERKDKVYGMRPILLKNRGAGQIPDLFSNSGIKNYWIARYYGHLKPNKSGWYRFVGKFDDVLNIRVKGLRTNGFSTAAESSLPSSPSLGNRIDHLVPVFDGGYCWGWKGGNDPWKFNDPYAPGSHYTTPFQDYYASASDNPVGSWKSWTPNISGGGSDQNSHYTLNGLIDHGGDGLVCGSWIYLDKSWTDVEVEVIYGEIPGGVIGGTLLVQRAGESYSKQGGRPILPVFTTTQLDQRTIDKINEIQKASGFKIETRKNKIPVMNYTSVEEAVDGWWEIIEHTQEITTETFISMIENLFDNFTDNGQPIPSISADIGNYLLSEYSASPGSLIESYNTLKYIIDEFNKLTNIRRTTLVFAAFEDNRAYWKYWRGTGIIKRDKLPKAVDLTITTGNTPFPIKGEPNITFGFNRSSQTLTLNGCTPAQISTTFENNFNLINNDVLVGLRKTKVIKQSDVSRFIDKMKILLKEICNNREVGFAASPGTPLPEVTTKSIIYHNYFGNDDTLKKDYQLFTYREVALGGLDCLTNSVAKLGFDDGWVLSGLNTETVNKSNLPDPLKLRKIENPKNYVEANSSIYLSKNGQPEEALYYPDTNPRQECIPKILFTDRYVHAFPCLSLVKIVYHTLKLKLGSKTKNVNLKSGQSGFTYVAYGSSFTFPNITSIYDLPTLGTWDGMKWTYETSKFDWACRSDGKSYIHNQGTTMPLTYTSPEKEVTIKNGMFTLDLYPRIFVDSDGEVTPNPPTPYELRIRGATGNDSSIALKSYFKAKLPYNGNKPEWLEFGEKIDKGKTEFYGSSKNGVNINFPSGGITELKEIGGSITVTGNTSHGGSGNGNGKMFRVYFRNGSDVLQKWPEDGSWHSIPTAESANHEDNFGDRNNPWKIVDARACTFTFNLKSDSADPIKTNKFNIIAEGYLGYSSDTRYGYKTCLKVNSITFKFTISSVTICDYD